MVHFMLHANRPGASEAELDAASEALGLPLPPALRVLYRFVDGQELLLDAALDADNQAPVHPSMLHGLLGEAPVSCQL